MILCSCNAITSKSIKDIMEIHYQDSIPSVEEIMEKHGCSIVCANCVRSIKVEIRKHYDINSEN